MQLLLLTYKSWNKSSHSYQNISQHTLRACLTTALQEFKQVHPSYLMDTTHNSNYEDIITPHSHISTSPLSSSPEINLSVDIQTFGNTREKPASKQILLSPRRRLCREDPASSLFQDCSLCMSELWIGAVENCSYYCVAMITKT